jgi:hypothetical protein
VARRYVRDARGRFAGKGFSGQTTGKGARLMSPGKTRSGGGSKITLSKRGGTVSKPQGLKPQPSVRSKPMAKGTTAKRAGTGRKVDVQIQRAKQGGQYGPDGHWYSGGAWMSQGKFVGGKPAKGAGANAQSSANQKGKGNDAHVTVIRNKAPQPKPLTPKGQGLAPQAKMSKTASKINQEFFGGSGFLRSDMEKQFRSAGRTGRAPISNTRYLGALASRLSSKELRARTLQAVKVLSKENRKGYIRDIQDARRNMEMTKFGVPRVGVSDRRLINAIRFDTAARNLAGQRAMRRRKGGRDSNEEYAWVTNAMLRRRK